MVSALPLHPLVVHAAVVFVPLAAFGTILIALWPAAARRFWPAVLLVATLALAAVPAATSTGEALEDRVGETRLVEAHAEQGEHVLPFVIVLWLAAAGIGAFAQASRRIATPGGETAVSRPRWRTVAVAVLVVLALVGGAGATAETVVSGHSGARAVWGK